MICSEKFPLVFFHLSPFGHTHKNIDFNTSFHPTVQVLLFSFRDDPVLASKGTNQADPLSPPYFFFFKTFSRSLTKRPIDDLFHVFKEVPPSLLGPIYVQVSGERVCLTYVLLD